MAGRPVKRHPRLTRLGDGGDEVHCHTQPASGLQEGGKGQVGSNVAWSEPDPAEGSAASWFYAAKPPAPSSKPSGCTEVPGTPWVVGESDPPPQPFPYFWRHGFPGQQFPLVPRFGRYFPLQTVMVGWEVDRGGGLP